MPEGMIGKQIRNVRDAGNISQAKLAENARIPLGKLRNLEQGRRIPRLDTAMRLASALGVTLDELVRDGAGEKRPKRKKAR